MGWAMDLAGSLANHTLGIETKVKEGFILGNRFYPFVGLKLKSNGRSVGCGINHNGPYILQNLCSTVTFPTNLYLGTATVKSSPFFP